MSAPVPGCAAAAGSRTRCRARPWRRRRVRVPPPGARPRVSASGSMVSRRTPRWSARTELLPLVEVFTVDEHRLHTPAGQDLVAHHEAGAEQAARRDESVACLEQRTECGEHRGHSAGGAEAGLRALDEAQPLLEHLDGGVAVPGVDEVVDVAGERRLGRSRALEHETGVQEDRFGRLFEAGTEVPPRTLIVPWPMSSGSAF